MLTRTVLSILCLVSLSCVSATSPATSPAPRSPRSIIFLIADGAGTAHFTVARMLRGADFQTGRLPYTGLVVTSPLDDSIVTDSASAATAFATGVRVRYTALSMDASGTPLPTALQAAEKLSKSTGLITTANFWDATAAAFTAHAPTRYETDSIVGQMLKSGTEIIAGGGLARFGKEGRPTIDDLAGAAGYALVRTAAELKSVTADRVLAVFDTQPQEIDFPEVRLPVLTQWALDRLSTDPEGFFLMVEQEGTDGASHANHTQKFIDSMISFDEAVGIALDFAAARNDVLVLVASDHECGGLQIHREKGTEMELVWATKSHTGEAVPVFAYGPGAEQFVGLMNGEDLGRKLISLVR